MNLSLTDRLLLWAMCFGIAILHYEFASDLIEAGRIIHQAMGD